MPDHPETCPVCDVKILAGEVWWATPLFAKKTPELGHDCSHRMEVRLAELERIESERLVVTHPNFRTKYIRPRPDRIRSQLVSMKQARWDLAMHLVERGEFPNVHDVIMRGFAELLARYYAQDESLTAPPASAQ